MLIFDCFACFILENKPIPWIGLSIPAVDGECRYIYITSEFTYLIIIWKVILDSLDIVRGKASWKKWCWIHVTETTLKTRVLVAILINNFAAERFETLINYRSLQSLNFTFSLETKKCWLFFLRKCLPCRSVPLHLCCRSEYWNNIVEISIPTGWYITTTACCYGRCSSWLNSNLIDQDTVVRSMDVTYSK